MPTAIKSPNIVLDTEQLLFGVGTNTYIKRNVSTGALEVYRNGNKVFEF